VSSIGRTCVRVVPSPGELDTLATTHKTSTRHDAVPHDTDCGVGSPLKHSRTTDSNVSSWAVRAGGRQPTAASRASNATRTRRAYITGSGYVTDVLRAAAYLIGALVVTVVVHAYLFRRLIVDTRLSSARRRHAAAGTLALAALLPAGMCGLLTMHDLPRRVASPLMWCAFGWVGALLFLLPLVLLGELARPLVAMNPERRTAMARIVGAVSGLATIGLSGASAAIAQLPPLVRRLRVPLPGLGVGSHGYKLVQLSDLHVSATASAGFVEALVATVNELKPDLVAITGDLVDGSVNELGGLIEPLARLRAREGVFFVTGNHEYLSGVGEWLDFLATLGVRVLRNERVAIGGGDGFDLLGVDDASGNPDLASAARGRDPLRASVLLSHRPDDAHQAAELGIGLQLSGHTHGGQIAPIGWALERLHQPYVYGLHTLGATLLYVTSGAGFWGPPMRLATRGEVVLFELISRGNMPLRD
jgi:predicted MPP superfamily phosphohydrolase